MALLGACEGGGPAPVPVDEVRAAFRAGGVADAIEIHAANRLALRQAELVAPDGSAVPAQLIDAQRTPTYAEDQRRGNESFRGNAYGIGNTSGTIPGPWSTEMGAAPVSQASLLTTLSTAQIIVPDEVAYRRQWRSYRIRLRFGDPPSEVVTRELPAPPPPPQ